MSAQFGPNGHYGCSHYQRKCFIEAPCCGKFYVCRFCHDENENHRIDRFAVRTIKCMICGEVQSVGQTCKNSRCRDITAPTRLTKFGHYFCEVCKFFDDSGRELYHCDKCGLCRVGNPATNIHCDTCDMCWNLLGYNQHRCKPNLLKENCPVCGEYLQWSRKTTYVLECGHSLHKDCMGVYYRRYLGCHRCLSPYQDLELGQDTSKSFENEIMPWNQSKASSVKRTFPLHPFNFRKMVEFLSIEDLGVLMSVSRELCELTLDSQIWKNRFRKRYNFDPVPLVHSYLQVKCQLDFTHQGAAMCVAAMKNDVNTLKRFLQAGMNPFLVTKTRAIADKSLLSQEVQNLLEVAVLRWLSHGGHETIGLLSTTVECLPASLHYQNESQSEDEEVEPLLENIEALQVIQDLSLN